MKKIVRRCSYDSRSVSLYDFDRKNRLGDPYCVASGILASEVDEYWNEYEKSETSKTAHDVLSDMGVTKEMIVMVKGEIAKMRHGYRVRKMNVETGRIKQMISVLPLHPCTDGTLSPIYSGGWDCEKYNVTAYLNARV